MNAASSGLFATSRRGGLTAEEIREIEAHRAKDRPTPWRVLAERYGRCEADLRRYIEPIFSDRAVAAVATVAAAVPVPNAKLALQGTTKKHYHLGEVFIFWTPVKDDELRRLYLRRDLSSTEIADKIGTTLHAIYARAQRLGIHRPGGKQYAVFQQREA